MTRPAKKPPKLKPCMAIATERDLCGKPAMMAGVAIVRRQLVAVHLCRKHGGLKVRR
jgi:hypothetical protein